MDRHLPRDADGYVDLDAMPGTPVELDLPRLAPVVPISDSAWQLIVSAAPHIDPDAAGIDVDGLLEGEPFHPTGVEPGPWLGGDEDPSAAESEPGHAGPWSDLTEPGGVNGHLDDAWVDPSDIGPP